ncbi:M56 family metallopeptidase [Streptacidiphilus sp. EB129]|uniref:M56 family metallopeptidase n=1 Tax=Streptacidiphilus sp. EB129 TaxID=3156262 RepID=UPI0035113199
MSALPALLLLCLLLAVLGPRLLARARWSEREPVLALWAWQCLVVAVLLCFGLALLLTAAAAWPQARALLFTGAPPGVEDAYGFGLARPWAVAGAFLLAVGGVRTALALAIEVRSARALRRRRERELSRQAPELPPDLLGGRRLEGGERLVVLENAQPRAWSVLGPSTRMVVTTGALHRLSDRELAAVLAHERGHVQARHHWLLHCAEALNNGFPGARIFHLFREQVGHLVELAADDSAARRHGRLATAVALVELNTAMGPAPTCPSALAEIPGRVDRLLSGTPRLPVSRRLRLTVAALAAVSAPLALAVAPGLRALF